MDGLALNADMVYIT